MLRGSDAKRCRINARISATLSGYFEARLTVLARILGEIVQSSTSAIG